VFLSLAASTCQTRVFRPESSDPSLVTTITPEGKQCHRKTLRGVLKADMAEEGALDSWAHEIKYGGTHETDN
jgi:hypothetical protein